MKKVIGIILLIFIVVVVIAFFVKSYSISYVVNNVKISEEYIDNRYHFEFDKKYIMDVYTDKKINKKMISDVKKIKDNGYECLILKSEKLDVYPLCRNRNNQISYDLVESKKLEKYFDKKEKVKEDSSKSFEFFNNLDKETFIAIWKYDGFYILNEDEVSSLTLFDEDRYSNDLCTNTERFIFLPDYDSNHTFKSFYVVDLKKQDYKKYDMEYEIDYDSYILGRNEEFVYLYDLKYKTEYEFNLKNGNVKVIGNEKEGFITYKNSEVKRSSYGKLNKKEEIFTFKNNEIYNYKNENNMFVLNYKENKKIKKIIYDKNIDYISSFNDFVYFLDGEYLYEYIPKGGSKKIARNFEWNFNKENTIFIYNE